MNRFDWDGLHEGDALHVHLSDDTVDRPVAVHVDHVVASGHRRGNAVRVQHDADGRRSWPTWARAHREAAPAAGSCWRCDLLA